MVNLRRARQLQDAKEDVIAGKLLEYRSAAQERTCKIYFWRGKVDYRKLVIYPKENKQ
jgi:hypothetical protein